MPETADKTAAAERALAAVQASETHYRRLFESAQDGILILDAVTRKIIDVNPFMVELLGYSHEEFLGKELWQLGLLKDEEASRDAFTELHESGYIRYGDLRLETQLGRRCEVEFISNIYDEDDRQVIQCSIRDITNRKDAENKMESLADDLAAAAEDYRRVLDNSLDIICQLDGEGRIVKVSPAAKKVWGYDPEELIGTSYWDIVHPDDHLKTIHASNNTRAGKPTSTFENRTIRKDGSIAYMMWSGNWSEAHQTMYCVARDVSEIKLAETALEESSTNYRALIESLPAIVCLSEPFQPYASIYISPNAKAFGYSVEEWAGRPDMWISLIHKDDRERVIREAADAIELGPETEIEYRMVTHDGQIHWMCDKGLLIPDPEGIVNGWQRVITDVTRSKLAEDELRKSEELHRVMISGVKDYAIFMLDDKGFIASWNAGAERVKGYRADEIIGQHFSQLYPVEVAAEGIPDMELVQAAAVGCFEDEGWRIRKDNSRFWAKVIITAIRNEKGELQGFTKVTHDITQRKQAEEGLIGMRNDLQLAVEGYERMLDYSLDVICSIDEEGRFAGVSNASRDVWGYEPDELIGKLYMDLVHPDDHAITVQAATDIMAGHPVKTFENRYLHKDGRIIPVMWSARWLEFDKTMFCVARDITENKFAEKALRQKDSLIRIAGKLTLTGGWAIEVPDGKVFWSDELFDILEFPKGEAPDLATALESYPEPGRERVAVGFEACMTIGMPLDIEVEVLTANKRPIFVRLRAEADRDADGTIVRVNAALQDISDRKHAEDQLRQSQKIEAVGRMAGGIAHDFNNMLTVINGYSELTLRAIPESDPMRSNIVEIIKAGERSADLTRQLLAFSRQQILQPKILDLNETIQDTSQMLHRLIGEDIELQLFLNPIISWIKADPGQLTQVIVNLTVNARDAMPHGGKVTILTDDIYLNEEFVKNHFPMETGNYVMLSLTDNGTGMDGDTRDRIFEPFFTTKRQGEGTGLGLATVYGIVKQSGGYIWTESEIGQGTTFLIYFPQAAEEKNTEETNSVENISQSGTESILVVEDEPIVRSLTRQMLEECGYHVIEAGSGQEALVICEQGDCRIDLLMTDVVMPGMSGRELAERLATLLPSLKVLFTSGYTNDAVIKHGITETMQNFLQKPFTFDVLSKKVRDIIDNVNS